MSPVLAGGFLTTAPPGKPRIMFLRFIHGGMFQNFILFYDRIIFHGMECYILFIHSPNYEHLRCFHILVFVNSAVMNMHVHILL